MPGTDRTSAPSLSALRRYFDASLYLLLLTSVLTLVSTGKLDLVTILAPPFALLIKGIRWWRGHGPELSHRAATLLTIAYFGFFPFDLWFISRALATGAPNPALYAALLATIHLLLFAMLVRLYSARNTRDSLFLALLAFATMLAAAILTVDTTFLAFFLVFLVLSVSTFVGLEMRRSAEGAWVPPLETGTPAARRLHRALGLTSAAVAVSALVMGAVIFFLLPRFTAGYLSGFNLQPSLMSGFGEDVELGQIGEIMKNRAVVMRVRVQGGPARMENVLWRGIALTTFDGRRWFTEPHQKVVVSQGPDGWFALGTVPPPLRRNATPLRYTVLLEPVATSALFLAAQAERVRGRFSPGPGLGLLLDSTDSLFNPSRNFGNLRYEGLSYVPAVPAPLLRAASTDYSDALREVYLQLPLLNPRIPALAQQLTAGAPTAYDKAATIENYLRTRFGYTLELSGTPTADPLAHFLFERRAGHCEYFAAAMTVMLRSQGVPARYVNGFRPGEYNEIGDDFIVRSSNAHSWVEVYFPGYGWIPFDPTPPAEEKTRGWLGHLALYWDWFELQWAEWVINYDYFHQLTLAQGLQRATRDWSDRARTSLARARRKSIERLMAWQARAIASPYTVPVSFAALLSLALLLRGGPIRRFLEKLWGLHISSRAELTPRLATLQYQEMLRLLARRGLAKQPAQTPLEFAASLPATELAAHVAQVTEFYQAARFGDQHTDPRQVISLLDSIRTSLRSRRR